MERREREAVHLTLVVLSIATIFSLFIALRPSNPTSVPRRVCKDANVLYLTELSTTAPRGAFTSQYVTELQLTRRITSSEGQIANAAVRADVHALATNLTSGQIAAIPRLNDLLTTCRSKGFLTGG